MRLYKHKYLYGDGLAHAFDMIVNERIYCSTSDTMNVPHEGSLLQDEIFERRRSQSVNSQWLYWRERDAFHARMKAAGQKKKW